jgi:mono/diheme cytochrome c family protein
MNGVGWRWAIIAVIALTVDSSRGSALGQETPEADTGRSGELYYREHVKPILVQHCFTCHGPQASIKGGLRLGSRADLLRGGDSGPAIDETAHDDSLLLTAINYSSLEMPPKGKLPAEQIEILTRWVRMGAPYDPAEEVHAEAQEEGPPRVTEQAKQFWAFRPVARPALPEVQRTDWIRQPLDAFVLARLEAEGLSPAPPADKATLLRRAFYDLIGLPPSPAQVEAFLNDDSPTAFERVVDDLLNSPQYGERWGRHWLDLVRYAETNSFERDGAKPFVWRYRDYVIESFNDDKPYDQFIREQLAGDELDQVTPETIIATGFYRIGPWDDEPSDNAQALYDDLDDVLSTTCQVFLGLTINCARCHDHKLDPIPQVEYYRMLAFFRNVRRYGARSHESVLDASVRVIASAEQRAAHEAQVGEHRQQVEAIESRLAEIEAALAQDLSDVEQEEFRHRRNRVPIARKRIGGVLTQAQFDQYAQLTAERDRLERNPPAGLDQALCVTERGPDAPPTHVLVRGNPHIPGDVVEPGFPSVLSPPEPQISVRETTAGRRRALAEWIASSENPLTSRVMANRLWQYHLGRGIVRSSNNFGQIGDRPTHPELLDWLAAELVAQGWRLKAMHRMIMLSSTYQMSSQASDAALAQDPENHWFWRYDMRRLSAEELWDSILSVNGTLNLARMGGPSFYPLLPAEVLHSQSQPGSGWEQSPPSERSRRSVYIHIKRSLLVPLLVSFDAADPDSSCPVRFTTTLPTQALNMMNGDFAQREAAELAKAALRAGQTEPSGQVAWILTRVLQRPPRDQEVARGVKLLQRLQTDDGLDAGAALHAFCVVALNLNEFIYLD